MSNRTNGGAPELATKTWMAQRNEQLRRKGDALSSPARKARPDLAERARAAGSGFVDEVSFGLADPTLSLADALWDRGLDGGLQGVMSRYRAHETRREAQDRADAVNLPMERGVGQAAGFLTSLAMMGVAAGAAKAVVARTPAGLRAAELLAKAPRLKGVTPKGLATMTAAAGAAPALAMQAVEDVERRRLSSAAKYGAVALGSILGAAVTLRGGLLRGGAVDGVTTSMLSDLADGHSPSMERAFAAGKVGAATSAVVGSVAERAVALMSSGAKGALGEALSHARILMSGEFPRIKPPTRLKSGGLSRPDFQISDGYVEAKLGPHARKSRRQLELEAEYPGRVAFDAWRLSDPGRWGAALATPLPVAASLGDPEPWTWRPVAPP